MTTKNVKKVQKFDFRTIKTFEDACKKTGTNPLYLPDLASVEEEFRKPMIAYYKLLIVYKAISNGWRPDWNNYSQWKYYPWFRVLSSGFGFSDSNYNYDNTNTNVSSHLCRLRQHKPCPHGKKRLYFKERW